MIKLILYFEKPSIQYLLDMFHICDLHLLASHRQRRSGFFREDSHSAFLQNKHQRFFDVLFLSNLLEDQA